MRYNIDFEIAAALFLSIFIILVKSQYATHSKSNDVYIHLLATVLGADVFDMITAITISYPYTVPVWVNYVLNMVFFLIVLSCVSSLPRYIRVLADENFKFGIVDLIPQIVAVAYALLIVSTPFTKLVIYFDENRYYSNGPLYYLVFAIPTFYLFYAIGITIVLHKQFEAKKIMSALAFMLLTALGEGVQLLFFPNVLVSYFAATVGGVIMLFAFETPDYHKLIRTTKELEENKELLDATIQKEQELSKILRQSTKTASWALYFDGNANMKEASWSDDFFRMLGYNPNEMGEEKLSLWQDSLHKEDRDRMLKTFADGMTFGEGFDTEYRLIDVNGNVKWCRGIGEVKFASDGKIENYHGLIQDITEAKINEQLNEEKLKALKELEESEKALKIALENAEVASKAKSRFLSNMSHDIRTPMNAIIGFTDIAKENINDIEQVSESIDRIQSSSKHLLSLINEVLDMSRIESGKTTIEAKPDSLIEMMSDLEGMVASDALSHGLSYITDYSGLMHENVVCDRLHINQILINLVGNAVKFTKEGGSIYVSLSENETDNVNIKNYVFTVRDTGIGMSPEFIDKIFEPFERERTSTISKIQGTGLGMSITKTLIDMMNGSIEVHSEVGVGSEFIITLPLELYENSLDEKIDRIESTKDISISLEDMIDALNGVKILLVDDNSTNRLVANKQLSKRGFTVTEAQDGFSAIEKIESDEEFDIVLLDIQMPGINGYETADRIRALEDANKSSIPIIAMTADAFEEDKRMSIVHQMNGHVAKPFKIDELIKTIYSLLK